MIQSSILEDLCGQLFKQVLMQRRIGISAQNTGASAMICPYLKVNMKRINSVLSVVELRLRASRRLKVKQFLFVLQIRDTNVSSDSKQSQNIRKDFPYPAAVSYLRNHVSWIKQDHMHQSQIRQQQMMHQSYPKV